MPLRVPKLFEYGGQCRIGLGGPLQLVENQDYVAAVNRVGVDGNGYPYSGHSALIDPTGQVLFEQEELACTPTLKLKYNVLADYRAQFPAWMDADNDLANLPRR